MFQKLTPEQWLEGEKIRLEELRKAGYYASAAELAADLDAMYAHYRLLKAAEAAAAQN